MNPDMEFKLPRRRAGIYHLIRAGLVVYVGQSCNLMARLGTHDFTQYDAARFFYCDPSELDAREKADIERLLPELNKEGVIRQYRRWYGRKNVYCAERAGAKAGAQ